MFSLSTSSVSSNSPSTKSTYSVQAQPSAESKMNGVTSGSSKKVSKQESSIRVFCEAKKGNRVKELIKHYNVERQTKSLRVTFNPPPTIKSSGKAFYTSKIRAQLIADMSSSQSRLPGCSLLFTILNHHVFDVYHALIRSPLGKQTKEKLSLLYFNISALLGEHASDLAKGNYWIRPIEFCADSPSVNLQEITLKCLNKLEPELHILEKELVCSKGKKFFEAIRLFQDIVSQEMHLLYKPASPSPDLSTHFSNLMNQIKNFGDMVENFRVSSTKVLSEFSGIKEYTTLLLQDKKNMFSLLSCVGQCVKECENNPKSIKALKALYHHLNKYKKESADRDTGIDDSCDFLIEHLNTPERERISLVIKNFRLLTFNFESLQREIQMTLFNSLVKESHLSLETIDTHLRNLVQVIENVYSSPYRNAVLSKIEEIDVDSLSDTDRSLLIGLSLIGSLFDVNVNDKWIDLFKLRQATFNKINPFERILALTDMNSAFDCLGHTFNSFQNHELLKMHDLDSLSPLTEIRSSLKDFFIVNQQFVEAVKVNFNSFFDTCFEKIETNEVKESETSLDDVMLALGLDDSKSKKKKKKEKQKSTPAQAEPSLLINNLGQSCVASSSAIISTPTEVMPLQFPKSNLATQATTFETLLSSISKLICTFKNAEVIAETDQVFRKTWGGGCLANLEDNLLQLGEVVEDHEFTAQRIFGNIDLIRRVIENTFGFVLSHFEVLDVEQKSIFQNTLNRTHKLHYYVQQALYSQSQRQIIPENVRQIIRAYKKLVFTLSPANICVNYLFSTALKTEVSAEQKMLLNYLTAVNTHFNAESIEQQAQLVKEGLHFVKELLIAIQNPEYTVNTSDHVGHQSLVVDMICLTEEINDLPPDQALLDFFPASTTSQESSTLVKIPITTRKKALECLEEALIWIEIRKISPVEGVLK